MTSPRNLTEQEVQEMYDLLKRNDLAFRKDLPEGRAFGLLVETKADEIKEIIRTGMRFPKRGEVYRVIKDPRRWVSGLPKDEVRWAYLPELNSDGTLPEYGFARIAPRALVVNSRLEIKHKEFVEKHNKKNKSLTQEEREDILKPKRKIFSTDGLIKEIIEWEEDLVKEISSVKGTTGFYHLELWHYDNESKVYFISSQAILGSNISAISPYRAVHNWEFLTQRYWNRPRGDGRISGLIHQKRNAMPISYNDFDAISRRHPIILP